MLVCSYGLPCYPAAVRSSLCNKLLLIAHRLSLLVLLSRRGEEGIVGSPVGLCLRRFTCSLLKHAVPQGEREHPHLTYFTELPLVLLTRRSQTSSSAAPAVTHRNVIIWKTASG